MFRIALALCMLLPTVASAQWFPNAPWNQTKQVGASDASGCPAGTICPTNQSQNWFNKDGLSRKDHVEHVHQIDTSGMTNAEVRQHQNDYHNTYGAGHPVRGTIAAAVSVPRKFVERVQSNYPSVSGTSGGGSSGGSSGSFAVGSIYKGELVTSIGELSPVAAPPLPASNAKGPLRERREFRSVLIQAAQEQVDCGDLSPEELKQITVMTRIPFMCKFLESAIQDKASEKGLANSIGAVDWNALKEFIKEMLPIILQLIKLFSANLPHDTEPYVVNTPNVDNLTGFFYNLAS